jgi:RNA polymerase primary sigma factor
MPNPPSERKPDTSGPTEVDEHVAPPSRVRSRGPGSRGEREAIDLYLTDLSSSRPLTREGEIAIGRRIEGGERAIVEAWLTSPVARAELVLTADDVRVGALTLRDLLLEPDAGDAGAGDARAQRLAELLARVLSLPRDLHGHVVADLAEGFAEVRLDPAVGERIERHLRGVAAEQPHERAAIEATLSSISRARRAVARAKGELVEANLRLALSIARQFQRLDVPLVDLAQEGNLGLIRAAESFDYRRGHRFGTYAAWWIKQAIRRAVLSQGKGLRIPAHLAEARRRIARARRELVEQLGTEPAIELVAERSGVSLEKVRMVAEVSMEPQSFDAPVGEDGDTSFGELVAGSDITADEALARRRLREQTLELLDGLTPREREVLERRYGIHDGEDETLEEIGKSCSLTRERIRQIEAKALEKLRPRSRKRDLGSYLGR